MRKAEKSFNRPSEPTTILGGEAALGPYGRRSLRCPDFTRRLPSKVHSPNARSTPYCAIPLKHEVPRACACSQFMLYLRSTSSEESMWEPGHEPWNKGKLVGQKLPLKQREIWSIRVRLQLA